MKRIKTAIIILLAVLVAAAGIFAAAYFFNEKNEKDAKAEEEKLVMFDFDSESVDKIEINNEDGQFIAEFSSEGIWQLTNTDDFVLNDTIVSSMATNMCSLKAVKILEDEDPSKYGFDNPVKVTCYIGDEAHTIIMGDTNPTYENFYAMKENDSNIYLIEFMKGSILAADKNSLKQTYIFPYMTYEVDHFALWEGNETDENIRFSMTKDEDNNWHMEKPNPDADVIYTEVNEFLTDASKDEVSTFIQEGCDQSEYSKFGFDNPQYVFEISAGDKMTKIIFGSPTENGEEIYGLFTETEQVVTFIPNQVALLGYNTLDLMDTDVFSTDISNVSTVTVTMNGKQTVLDMSMGENEYKVDDVNVSEISEDAKTAFVSFFNSFNNAYFESVEKAATPSGEAEITVEYILTSNVVAKLEYIPDPDSDEYFVVKDGVYTGFTVSPVIIEAINSSYNDLMNIIK